MTDLHRIERYEGLFAIPEMAYENVYYTAMLDGEPYLYLHSQFAPGTDFIQLHINVLAFNRRVLRECLSDFVTLKKMLKESGIKKIVGLKDKENVCQWEKLVRLLGFAPPVNTVLHGEPYKLISMEVA